MAITMDDLRRHGVLHHGIAFFAVILGLLLFNFYTGRPYWVVWVILGWGAGLALHAWLALRR